MRYSLLFKVTLLCLGLLLIGCGSSDNKVYPPDQRFDHPSKPFSSEYNPVKNEPKEAPRYPWEIWEFDADLNGAPLNNPLISNVDKKVRFGDRQGAVKEYQELLNGPRSKVLRPNEIEALTFRLASTQIAVKQPEAALLTLTKYFSTKSESVDQVDARFSILFAYAYARHKDMSQSLAWFSRANGLAASGGVAGAKAYPGVTAGGVRLVLRTVPSGELIELKDQWANDPFMRVLIGEEYQRRSHSGNIEPRVDEFDFLLGLDEQGNARWIVSDAQVVSTGQSRVIGVLLPLSGRFANLGESLKNGIKMAFEAAVGGVDPAQHPALEFVDSTEDPLEATARARELVEQKGVDMIIGPLLADQVEPVLAVARGRGVPVLSLSRGAAPRAGDVLLRLAPTAESQVNSLLVEATDPLKVTKFAVVYPTDPAARELVAALSNLLVSRGLPTPLSFEYQRGQSPQFLQIVQQIEEQKIQAVFIPDQIVTASQLVTSFPRAERERMLFLGPLLWDDQRALANSSSAMDGAIYVSPFASNLPIPEIVSFNEGYQSRYGRKPDFLAAQGFDAATLVLAAYAYRQSSDETLLNALLSLGQYQGLTGKITVDKDGEMRREYRVVQFIDGHPVDVSTQIANGTLVPFSSPLEEKQQFIYRGNQQVPQTTAGNIR